MLLARARARLYNATEAALVGMLRNGLVQWEGGAMAAVTAKSKPGVAKAPAIKSRAYIHVPRNLG